MGEMEKKYGRGRDIRKVNPACPERNSRISEIDKSRKSNTIYFQIGTNH